MDMPSSHAIREAAHACFTDAYARECENRQITFGGPGIDLCTCVEYLPDEVQFPIMVKHLIRIADAWGYSVRRVFTAMGLAYGGEDEASALRYLFFGCLGHGRDITDDYGDRFYAVCAAYGKQLDPSPIDIDDWDDMAIYAVEADVESGNLDAPDVPEEEAAPDLPLQATILPAFPDNILANVGKHGAYLGCHTRADGKQMLFVVTAKLHYDSPTRHDDGSMGWDCPERVPAYMQLAARNEFDRMRKVSMPYYNDHKPLPSELPAQPLLQVPRPRLYLPNPRALTLV